MLEHVMGDDEVLRGVGDGREAVGGREEVGLDDGLGLELGEVPARVLDREEVHVADAGAGGEREGIGERPDLEPVAAEAAQEVPTLHRGRA